MHQKDASLHYDHDMANILQTDAGPFGNKLAGWFDVSPLSTRVSLDQSV